MHVPSTIHSLICKFEHGKWNVCKRLGDVEVFRFFMSSTQLTVTWG